MPANLTPLSPPVHHVFVDFENVHTVDLAVFELRPISFTLLLGAKQSKLDAALVEKLMEHATSVQLVRLTSSGKNALDFTLAYYVGRAVAADPTGHFHIISKDTGFDPLIAHLRSRHLRAARHDDFAAMTGKAAIPSASVKPAPIARPNTSPAHTPSSVPSKAKVSKPMPAQPKVTPSEADLEARVLEHLRTHPNNRPRRKTTLISHLRTLLGNKRSGVEAERIIEDLSHAGHVTINDKGAVTYRL